MTALGPPLTVIPMRISNVLCAFVLLALPSQAAAQVTIDPADVELGSVRVGMTGMPVTVNVRNAGGMPLGVMIEVDDPDHFKLDPPMSTMPTTVDAMGAVPIKISCAPTGMSGPVEGVLRAIHTMGMAEAALHCRGLAPALTASPPNLDFGPCRVTQTCSKTVKARNTGGAPLVISKFDVQGRRADRFSVEPAAPVTIPPMMDQDLTFKFTPKRTGDDGMSFMETNSATVVITSDSELETPRIGVAGIAVVPGIQLSGQGQIDFGNVNKGAMSMALEVAIANETMFPLTITDVKVSGKHPQDFKVLDDLKGKMLEGTGELRFKMQFVPTAIDERDAVLDVTTSAPEAVGHSELVGVGINTATTPMKSCTAAPGDGGAAGLGPWLLLALVLLRRAWPVTGATGRHQAR